MKNNTTEITEALRQVVADSYALLGQIHLCHWNVRGPGFFALHTAFEQHYTELFPAIDEIAERIRALGALAPGGLSNLAGLSSIKEIAEDSDAETMVAHLADSNSIVVDSLRKARDLAADGGDSESEDLAISRIQLHEKNIWMLRSFLE